MSRKSRRQERKEANYDADPPRCLNCQSYGRNGTTNIKWCSWIGFQLPTSHGICDNWRGRDGTVLEAAQRIEEQTKQGVNND